MQKRVSKLGHSQNVLPSAVSAQDSDHPGDDDSDAEVIVKKAKSSRLPLKDLKQSNTQPGFALAVAVALRDFHVHILKQNMFPSEVDA